MKARSALLSLMLLTLLGALCFPARAQSPDTMAGPPAVGDRVRLEVVTLDTEPGEMAPYRWTGRLIGSDTAALHIRSPAGETLRVQREFVRQIEVWVPQGRATARGVEIGALLGGVLGGAIVTAACLHAQSHACPESSRLSFAAGFALGAVPGGAIGALVGLATPLGVWRAARLPEAK